MELVTTAIAHFKAGGPVMYFILLVLACGTAIVIDRALALFIRARLGIQGLWKEVEEAVYQDKLENAMRLCEAFPSPVARILWAGLHAASNGGGEKELTSAVEEATLEVIPAVEKRTHYLYSLANLATLLGLLGTVIGLIQSFGAVSLADPAQKATLLAKGISLALNTTAFGLIVAIPLVLTYSVLQARGNRLISQMDEYATRLVNLLTSRERQLGIKRDGTQDSPAIPDSS